MHQIIQCGPVNSKPQSEKMLKLKHWLNKVLQLQRPKTGQAELHVYVLPLVAATPLFPIAIYSPIYSEIPNPELPCFHPTRKTINLTALAGCDNINNNNGFKARFGVEICHGETFSP